MNEKKGKQRTRGLIGDKNGGFIASEFASVRGPAARVDADARVPTSGGRAAQKRRRTFRELYGLRV